MILIADASRGPGRGQKRDHLGVAVPGGVMGGFALSMASPIEGRTVEALIFNVEGRIAIQQQFNDIGVGAIRGPVKAGLAVRFAPRADIEPLPQ